MPTAPADFIALYDQHVERVYRYLLARAASVEDAEDLTAETFSAALESLHRLREGEPPLPWLIGIARHKLADHQRRQVLPGGLPRTTPLETLPDPPLGGPSTEEQAGLRLDTARVACALQKINAARAEAVALHYFAGLNMSEVGRALGKSEEAAKKLVQRGLSELRERMGAVGPTRSAENER
jgi:RNA polymerase sigma-70 factor (ECF subfamily)